jgi:hypothetical protein
VQTPAAVCLFAQPIVAPPSLQLASQSPPLTSTASPKSRTSLHPSGISPVARTPSVACSSAQIACRAVHCTSRYLLHPQQLEIAPHQERCNPPAHTLSHRIPKEGRRSHAVKVHSLSQAERPSAGILVNPRFCLRGSRSCFLLESPWIPQPVDTAGACTAIRADGIPFQSVILEP